MKPFRLLCTVAALAAALQLTGCATPATSQAMTIKPGTTAPVNPRLKGAIKVAEVTGGKDTNPLWTSQVDNAGFRKALQDSLAISGYLAPEAGGARYEVSAALVALEQPMFGLTFDVKSTVNYKLTGSGIEKSVPVSVTGTATTSDTWVAIERLRVASERSILENIKAFINQLGSLAD